MLLLVGCKREGFSAGGNHRTYIDNDAPTDTKIKAPFAGLAHDCAP
jgi:hypothetical protein